MKIQIKLFLLLILSMAVLLSGIIIYKKSEERRWALLLRKEQKEKEVTFDKTLSLNTQSLQTLAYDYSCWDDMVIFIVTRDKIWAEQNLDETLSSYNADELWVYDSDFSFLYSANNKEDPNLKELPLPKEALSKLFKDIRFCHFFLNTTKGLMEIRGATVHPSSDSQRETQPQGYFFVGRLWDSGYINQLSELIAGTVTISPIKEEPIFRNEPGFKKGVITFSKILYGWDKAPVARINVWFEPKIFLDLRDASKNEFVLILSLSICIGVFVFVAIARWINAPLKLITRTLTTENLDYINNLLKYKNEFGDISRLIYRFFGNKTELVKEITQHRQTEERLRQQCEELEGLIKTRTTELRLHSEQLQQETAQRKLTEEELIKQRQRLDELIEKQTEELRLHSEQLQQETIRGKHLEEELIKQSQQFEETIKGLKAQLSLVSEQLQKETAEHKRTEETLQKAGEELRIRLEERTKELERAKTAWQAETAGRRRAEETLQKAGDELIQIEARTKELKLLNEQLQQEIAQRKLTEEELRRQRVHLEELIQTHIAEIRLLNTQLQQETAQREQMEEELNKQLRLLEELKETQAAELELLNAQLQKRTIEHKEEEDNK